MRLDCLEKMFNKTKKLNVQNEEKPMEQKQAIDKKIALPLRFRTYLIRTTEQRLARLRDDTSSFIDSEGAEKNIAALEYLLKELTDEQNIVAEKQSFPSITHIDLVSNGEIIKGFQVVGESEGI
jgi:hypothetical protein